MRSAPITLSAAFVALAATHCNQPSGEIRIGAKDFTEQHLLAETIEQLLESTGDWRVKVVVCGDTHACQRRLRDIGLV